MISKKSFDYLSSKQTLWNEVIAKMCADQMFIQSQFSSVTDPFVAKLYGIWLKAKDSKFASKFNVAVVRNDYMLDSFSGKYKQIEFNLIAVSFLHISNMV